MPAHVVTAQTLAYWPFEEFVESEGSSVIRTPDLGPLGAVQSLVFSKGDTIAQRPAIVAEGAAGMIGRALTFRDVPAPQVTYAASADRVGTHAVLCGEWTIGARIVPGDPIPLRRKLVVRYGKPGRDAAQVLLDDQNRPQVRYQPSSTGGPLSVVQCPVALPADEPTFFVVRKSALGGGVFRYTFLFNGWPVATVNGGTAAPVAEDPFSEIVWSIAHLSAFSQDTVAGEPTSYFSEIALLDEVWVEAGAMPNEALVAELGYAPVDPFPSTPPPFELPELAPLERVGSLVKISDHGARAVARLAQQLKGSATTIALLVAFCRQVQAIEDAAWQLLESRSLERARGVQLDRIGRLVGCPREGVDDPTYYLRIRAQIIVNRKSGELETLIQLLRYLAGDVPVRIDEGGASFVAHLVGVEVADPHLFARLLRAAKAGGVRALFHYLTAPRADSFTFDDPDSPGLGFSDTTGTTGGKLAGIL